MFCLIDATSDINSPNLLVREKGLEPSRLATLAPKASVSTIPPLARRSYFTRGCPECLQELLTDSGCPKPFKYETRPDVECLVVGV